MQNIDRIQVGTTTYYIMDPIARSSLTVCAGYCSTAADTAAKTATWSYYALTSGYLLITHRYTNTAAEALTMDIASTGALPIYINGTVSSSTNYTLPAGAYLVYCDGTKYYYRTDGKVEGLCEKAPSDNGYYVQHNGSWVSLSTLDSTGY